MTTNDALGRPLRDLRVSVTDRCNLRCPYCMPREAFGADFAFVDRSQLLTFEEITRIATICATLGVRKIRLTGGEPLLRRDLPRLVAMLADVAGIEDVAITTNGILLAAHADGLVAAGLRRVTVSLDALDPDTFTAMSDSRFPVARVLDGLAAAHRAGLRPVKVNTVVRRGMNDSHLVDLARFGRDHGLTIRFIEYMDVGTTNHWAVDDVVPASEIVERVTSRFPAAPVSPTVPGEVATRYRYLDGAGEFGVIASVSRPFCGSCVRVRLSPVGELFTCLFASRGHDLRAILRSGADDERLAATIARIWTRRDDRYSELRAPVEARDGRVEMSYIGG
ncbi:MAG: GTP 3',8-cyclase MoaA [Actinobacteria bacterium]|nr:GTP 3',8-cyclase MoaA [Actinomycetota bacterium]